MTHTPETIVVRPSIPLNPAGDTCVGSGPSADQPLYHPLVAARHVTFSLGSGPPTLHDHGAGTFVNGRRVIGRRVPIRPGDQIDIGPYLFTFTGVQLDPVASMDRVRVAALGLRRVVGSGPGERVLFDRVSLIFRPGEFTCVLGPSGCGKSSLLAALAGRVRLTAGCIRVNGRDLYTRFEAIKRHVVLVPQKPLVHAALGVEQALRFTARLRLPLSADRGKRVDELVTAMLLQDRRRQAIASLSGGQEKRFCLANELVSDPGLILLDEVTSGLDPHVDAELMVRFHEMAERGRTLICVTHHLGNVPGNCHQVVFLAPGGRLAFAGTPEGALDYFKVGRLDTVFPLLTAENAEALAAEFETSTEGRAYYDSRLEDAERPAAGPIPTIPPAATTPSEPIRERTPFLRLLGTVAYQTAVLMARQLALLGREPRTLLSLLFQVALVAAVLCMAFGKFEPFPEMSEEDQKKQDLWDKHAGKESKDKIVHEVVLRQTEWVRRMLNLTFLIGVTSFWFGCNNAARELVRERAIFRQEQFFNLRPSAYFLSKLLILTVIGWLQVLILLLAVWWVCQPPGAATAYLPTLLALAFAGATLGLFISAVASSESVAVALIPIAVIPQIILSGAIVKLTGIVATLAGLFVTTYWGKQSMDALLTGRPMEFAQEPRIALIEPSASSLPMAAILLHAVVFSLLTLAALSSDGSISGTLGQIKEWFLRTIRRGHDAETTRL